MTSSRDIKGDVAHNLVSKTQQTKRDVGTHQMI